MGFGVSGWMKRVRGVERAYGEDVGHAEDDDYYP